MTIAENYQRVVERIHRAALRCSRAPESIRLVVVTKGHPLETIEAAIKAGARIFGENYVEEAKFKISALTGRHSLEWHMIGHIQSRKAREVVENFNWVHSVDSMKLAKRLNDVANRINHCLPVLLECNVSGEESKFGFSFSNEATWMEHIPEISEIVALPNLRVCGLMTMAPFFDFAESARPYYDRLRRLRIYLEVKLPDVTWNELSMGMSGDFEVAIEEGATLVRIGTAILGTRPMRFL